MNVVLLMAAMVWQVDDGWVEVGSDNWELNSGNTGSYSIVGSLDSEFYEAGLRTRWRKLSL